MGPRACSPCWRCAQGGKVFQRCRGQVLGIDSIETVCGDSLLDLALAYEYLVDTHYYSIGSRRWGLPRVDPAYCNSTGKPTIAAAILDYMCSVVLV